MKILKYILYGILAIVVIFLLIAVFAPKKVKVERSVTIQAPQPVVFEKVRSLRAMHDWSPFIEQDPNIKIDYEGNDGEVGSVYKWKGNDKVGSGQQTITAVNDHRVDMNLEFKEPWESKATTFVDTKEDGEGTKVTWGFETETPFPMNAMMVFMDMDGMLGKDFEKGLNKLKAQSEGAAASAPAAASYEIHEQDMPARIYIGKRETVGFAEMEKFYSTNFPAIMQSLQKAKKEPAGAPSGLYYKWDEKSMKADVAAAIPVADDKAKISGFQTISVPAGKVLHIAYYGSYEKSGDAHMAMDKYLKEKGLKNGMVIEEYVTDPMTEKDTAKWLTNIYYTLEK